jgi:hypothetical protein
MGDGTTEGGAGVLHGELGVDLGGRGEGEGECIYYLCGGC